MENSGCACRCGNSASPHPATAREKELHDKLDRILSKLDRVSTSMDAMGKRRLYTTGQAREYLLVNHRLSVSKRTIRRKIAQWREDETGVVTDAYAQIVVTHSDLGRLAANYGVTDFEE